MTREEILKEAEDLPISSRLSDIITDFALAQIKKREKEIVENLKALISDNPSLQRVLLDAGLETAIEIVEGKQ